MAQTMKLKRVFNQVFLVNHWRDILNCIYKWLCFSNSYSWAENHVIFFPLMLINNRELLPRYDTLRYVVQNYPFGNICSTNVIGYLILRYLGVSFNLYASVLFVLTEHLNEECYTSCFNLYCCRIFTVKLVHNYS